MRGTGCLNWARPVLRGASSDSSESGGSIPDPTWICKWYLSIRSSNFPKEPFGLNLKLASNGCIVVGWYSICLGRD
jgi:hypothetical protein